MFTGSLREIPYPIAKDLREICNDLETHEKKKSIFADSQNPLEVTQWSAPHCSHTLSGVIRGLVPYECGTTQGHAA